MQFALAACSISTCDEGQIASDLKLFCGHQPIDACIKPARQETGQTRLLPISLGQDCTLLCAV